MTDKKKTDVNITKNPDKIETMPFDRGGLYARVDISNRALTITILILVIILILMMTIILMLN
jgi:hypothetical protein